MAQVILNVGSTVCIHQGPFSGAYWIGLQHEDPSESAGADAGVFETLKAAKAAAERIYGALGWTEGDQPDEFGIVARGRLVMGK